MSQRHLCIIVRGSRRPPSNDEVPRLEERTAEQRLTGSNHLEVAFLEVDEPSIPQGLQRCTADGAREIIVFPYFHAAGYPRDAGHPGGHRRFPPGADGQDRAAHAPPVCLG
jgi:hypothetical protein